MATPRHDNIRNVPDLRELLWGSAGMYGTYPAFREKRDGIYQSISFGRFRDETEALGTALCARLPQGKRSHVLIIGKNSYFWVLSYMALVCGAGIPVPADAELSAEELSALAAECDASAVLYAADEAHKIAALPGLITVSFEAIPRLVAEGRSIIAAGDRSFRSRDIDRHAPAALFYTSGTTGRAKGVLLSHANITFLLSQIAHMHTVTPSDTFLSVLPLSHVYECVLGFLMPLYCGATVAFAEDLAHLMQNMREVHPTTMVTIPFLANAIYEKFWALVKENGTETQIRRAIAVSDPVRSYSARQTLKEKLLERARAPFGGVLRRMWVVGAFLPAAVQKGLRQIGIFAVQGYGLTECAGLAALGREDVYRDGTAGLCFPDSVIDIYNACPDGSGEIRYKGKNVMLGYYKDEAQTAAVLDGEWLYTGDFGRIDADGFLHIIGRSQNCIEKTEGKVCPEELEALLMQSPFVSEAVVVGVPNADGTDYEIAALIWCDREHAAEVLGIDYTAQELEKAVGDWVSDINEGLVEHKQIPLFALRDRPFERNAAGRILRGGLVDEILSAAEE